MNKISKNYRSFFKSSQLPFGRKKEELPGKHLILMNNELCALMYLHIAGDRADSVGGKRETVY